jgi:uncharacterized protein with HEPN domain
MYDNKNLLYLISAIAATEKAMHYAQDFKSSLTFLEADEQLYFNATITLLIAIGEEVKKIDSRILQTDESIEWNNIVDMRNVLAHDYRGIDEDIVFEVVKKELPKLEKVLIGFLKLFTENEVAVVLETKHYKHLKGLL